MAWATGIANAVAKSKTGAGVDGLVYESDVFEKREGLWLLVSHTAPAVPKPMYGPLRRFRRTSDLRLPCAIPALRSFCRRKSAEGGLDPLARTIRRRPLFAHSRRPLRASSHDLLVATADVQVWTRQLGKMICDHFDDAARRRGARHDPELALRQTSALALEIVPDGQRLELGDEAQPLRRVRGNDRL